MTSQKIAKFHQDIRHLLIEKYRMSNKDVRILWNESDTFVSTFLKGNVWNIAFHKFMTLIWNSKERGLLELNEDLCDLYIKLIKNED